MFTSLFTSLFWKLAAERAIKTFAQTLAGVLVVTGAGNWVSSLSVAAMAALVSVLTSVGSLKVGPDDSPSVVAGDPAAGPLVDPPPATVTVPTTARVAAPATV